jgi:hypothetical protein
MEKTENYSKYKIIHNFPKDRNEDSKNLQDDLIELLKILKK